MTKKKKEKNNENYFEEITKYIEGIKKLEDVIFFDNWGDGRFALKYKDEKSYHTQMEKYWQFMDEYEGFSDENQTKEFVDLLHELLKVNPLLFDIAREEASIAELLEDIEIALVIYESYYRIFHKLLPDSFEFGTCRIPWGIMENRPLMRFLHSRAVFIEEIQGPLAAQPFYEEILLMNPDDNQGIRGLLATIYLKTHNSEALLDLATNYPGDLTPEIFMGKVLGLYRLGKKDEAERFLIEIRDYSKHVVKEILKSKHYLSEKDIHPNGVKLGGADEAYYYWEAQGELWKKTKGARAWLKKMTLKWKEKD